MPEIPGRPKRIEPPRVYVETYYSMKAAEAAEDAAKAEAKADSKKEAR